MKSRLKNFFMNNSYVAGVIIACGIVMDIGVNITKFSIVTVTESYMDYIYSAIITIAILSFSIIALISGMFDKYIFYNNATDEMLDFSECLLEIASGQAYAPLESPSPRDNELLNSLYYIIMNSGLMITLAKADMVYSDRQASRELMDWLYDMYIEYYYSRAIEGKRPELDKWLKKHEKTVRDYPWEELLEAVETAIENGDNLNKKIKEKEEIEEA